MTIDIRELWGRPGHSAFQVRGGMASDRRAYNVAVFGLLSIPHWILVRRSSAMGAYGDSNGLPI